MKPDRARQSVLEQFLAQLVPETDTSKLEATTTLKSSSWTGRNFQGWEDTLQAKASKEETLFNFQGW